MLRKHTSPRTLFDEQNLLDKLSKLKDPLERLSAIIDFEVFRPELESLLKKEAKGRGGRPPCDYLLMFKILILQRYYNFSDDNMEFQILDLMSFKRFLGVDLAHYIPDSKTIWHFRERLSKKEGGVKRLFDYFTSLLEKQGLVAHEGKMIDASFVEAPRQRNSREENKEIKAGSQLEGWGKQENKHKVAQKDIDARYTKKNNQLFYGYKDHVKADTQSKIITNYTVTSAFVHDSQTLEVLLNKKDMNQPFYAESAYTGTDHEQTISIYKMINEVCKKGTRNHPCTEKQKQSNRKKSKTRARVEHIFGFLENNMNGSHIRSIGIRRADAIGLMNLTYNLFGTAQLYKINGRGTPCWS
ncbi:MAG: IS5 family transposase [Cyclobacteriaceae bacterium]|jgi:IS5 family transposase